LSNIDFSKLGGMGGAGGMPDMSALAGAMGGAGGMPDLSALAGAAGGAEGEGEDDVSDRRRLDSDTHANLHTGGPARARGGRCQVQQDPGGFLNTPF
jgi:hypothetical protein